MEPKKVIEAVPAFCLDEFVAGVIFLVLNGRARQSNFLAME